MELDEARLQDYLTVRFGPSARLIGFSLLGQDAGARDLKGYGYGVPVKVDYAVAGHAHSAVLETVTPGPFGHEHMSDRAQILLWSHDAFNRLPRHVRSLDVGGFAGDGSLVSVSALEEFFVLNDYVPGNEYYKDLERLRDGGGLQPRDLARVDALCDYLVGIHSRRGPDPALYVRRVRELVGHHECIMGILDSYPRVFDGGNADVLEDIERSLVRWRWRLKSHADRVRQVHGDFHPWNILFQDQAQFVVLDRSRGEWGDPADDVSALTVNYLFFSLQRTRRLEGDFETLFVRFWERYLAGTGDTDLPAVVAPFFAFRALVTASPVWYPRLGPGIRGKLLTFVRSVLEATRFDPLRVNDYCEGKP